MANSFYNICFHLRKVFHSSFRKLSKTKSHFCQIIIVKVFSTGMITFSILKFPSTLMRKSNVRKTLLVQETAKKWRALRGNVGAGLIRSLICWLIEQRSVLWLTHSAPHGRGDLTLYHGDRFVMVRYIYRCDEEMSRTTVLRDDFTTNSSIL